MFFSKNLLNFENVNETNYDHRWGDVVTFNGRLTAIGGIFTRKVEVYEGWSWNSETIQPIGNKDGYLSDFTSLEIKSQLYVFGNILVYYNTSRLNFVLKLNNVLLRWGREYVFTTYVHRLEV